MSENSQEGEIRKERELWVVWGAAWLSMVVLWVSP